MQIDKLYGRTIVFNCFLPPTHPHMRVYAVSKVHNISEDYCDKM